MSRCAEIERLLDIVRRLRDPQNGCPWDRKQNFDSIAPYTIEEAYEVVDAIDRKEYEDLRGELGDLLFQVVFHAQLAEERQLFSFADVARSIAQKLVHRHPHVFANDRVASVADQHAAWEKHKATERAARGLGVLGDVPLALPALTRAQKLGKRAASVGFDWADTQGPRASIDSELKELDVVLGGGGAPAERALEELGDVLFSVVNVARHIGIDAEEALRASNRKFCERFQDVEAILAADGKKVSDATAGELDALWRKVKEKRR